MNWKQRAADILCKTIKLDKDQLLFLLERPKNNELGDLALPCFHLAKQMRQSPPQIAHNLAKQIIDPFFDRLEAVGPYLNMFIDRRMAAINVLTEIIAQKEIYGNNDSGQNHTVTIDFSSPNIAKPFSMGHLRSTIIGQALANLAAKNGYQPIRINHLGDWGTQFGKLIVAYRMWGNKPKIETNPITELLKLYVRFHNVATPELEAEARLAFQQLEQGDSSLMELWQWFRDESLREFKRIYQLLGVEFDSYHGEAFYINQTESVIKLLIEQQLLVESDGAQVVPLETENLPPLLVHKADGTTLYATRDLAAAIYRYQTYHFVKSLYVVGNEQSLHFKQLKAVLHATGFDWAKTIEHIPFGMMLADGKKMSTRKGRITLLEDVLAEAIQLATVLINERNPTLADKETIAEQIGIGAVIFHDLKTHRTHDIEFSLTAMLNFDGETGPYLQYTYARSCSILAKANYQKTTIKQIDADAMWPIITLLVEFPSVIETAWHEYDPSKITRFALDLARRFNQYYANIHILSNDDTEAAKLQLVMAVNILLKESLRLLGIAAPTKM